MAPSAAPAPHLVDEQDDVAGRLGNLLEDGLEPFLELAAVLGPGNQGAHIQLDNALLLQTFRYVTVHNALRQTLGDGGLADARLADEGRVVLAAPRENLNDAPNLLVPSDDGIQLSLAGHVCEIAAVFFQSLVRRFRVLGRDALRAPHGLEGAQDRVLGEPVR